MAKTEAKEKEASETKKPYNQVKIEQVTMYQTLFATPEGEFVLKDLRRAFGDRPSFVDGDSHLTAYNEGQRDVYLRIKKLLEMDLKEIIERGTKTNG